MKGGIKVDIQLKKGILDICILKYLDGNTSYGYKIIEDMKDIINISESTLYPILRRLENDKCVSVRKEEHNMRIRKYYEITDEGKSRINKFALEWNEIKKIYDYILEGNHE